jgi:hypothetical protein
MARSLARVLKTEMSTDLPLKAMAQALRKKGRGRDTVLAHITPREAAKLKREGGSGTINPDTGLPEFDDGFDFGALVPETPSYQVDTGSAYGGLPSAAPSGAGYSNEFGLTPMQAAATTAPPATSSDYSFQPTPAYQFAGTPYDASAGAMAYAPPAASFADTAGQQAISAAVPSGYTAAPYGAGTSIVEQPAGIGTLPDQAAAGGAAPAQQGFFDKALSQLTANPLQALIAGGGIGLTGLNYLRAQNQAKQQAQAYQQAYQQAASQSQALAQPFIQQGGTQLAQALQGQLSAAQQQQLQAAQAATQQGIAGRGGVGAQQAERSLEDLRQRLLADQQTLALKLYGEGTPLLQSAIQAQLQGTIGSQNIQAQASQAAGQAASALLQSLAALYGYSGKSK